MSTSSINNSSQPNNTKLISSLLLSHHSQKSKNKFFTQRHNSISNGSTSSSTKGFRGFLGKLMRSSLVNINDPGPSSQNGDDSNLFEPLPQNQVAHTIDSSGFKRGGLRSTANARLQNSFTVSNNALNSAGCELATIGQLQHQLQTQLQLQKESSVSNGWDSNFAFAEWPADRVYDWLRQSGFESYFPVNADGVCINKWIKSGLHLLQASQFDFEKV
jgi:hypothetical protein